MKYYLLPSGGQKQNIYFNAILSIERKYVSCFCLVTENFPQVHFAVVLMMYIQFKPAELEICLGS